MSAILGVLRKSSSSVKEEDSLRSSKGCSPAAEISTEDDPPSTNVGSPSTKSKNGRSDGGMFAKLKGLLGWQSLEVTENENNSKLEDTFNKDQKQSLWQMASGLIGTDPVSLISLPVWLFEPTTFLTRMAEPMYFAPQFFDKVANETDPILRLAHIAAFNMGVLCFTQRTWKPFNPVLGETFEFVTDKATFVAEQVCHHPPISAGETRSVKGDWICHQEVHVKTKLWGNYVEIYPIGNTHLYCPKTGDHYYWNQPNVCVHNIIVGGIWYDYYGTVEITNEQGNGEKARLVFHRSGMFSGRGTYRKVTGEITDGEGRVRMLLKGNWNKQFTVTPVAEDGTKGEEYTLWTKDKDLVGNDGNKWKIPYFAQELLKVDPSIEKVLPTTDSRLRADLHALGLGDTETASREKSTIEKHQRAARSERQKRGIEWQPKYFQKKGDGVMSCSWQYIEGTYWEERQRRSELQH